MRRLICIFCMGVCLTMGCYMEHTTGISRMKQLHQIPDTKCILSVLRQFPEIQKITVRSEGDVKTGNRPSMDKVIYEGNGFWVQLVVTIDEQGKMCFIQDHLTSPDYK